MIGNPIEKRRAERLSELLEEADGGIRRHGRGGDRDGDMAQLVSVGQALRQAAPAAHTASAPDPAFQASLRHRLLAEAAATGIGSTTPDPVPVRASRRKRFTIAATVAGLLLGLSGVATASADAVPGDALYPVKRSTERAQLALAGSDVSRGQLYLEFAHGRLEEAQGLSGEDAALATAFADMDSDTVEGVRSLTSEAIAREDPALLGYVDDFVADQRPGLESLRDSLSGPAAELADESLDLLADVAERSDGLHTMLLCSGVRADEADRLGPVPVECSALPGTEGEQVVPGPSGTTPGESGDTPDTGTSPSEEPASSASEPSASGSPSGEPGDDPTDEEPGGGLLSELGDLLSGLLG
ncbi:hypothetical protein LX16_4134 [Stackebrandtia albiflava]|uniref:DUF5667 domain-containing protein n=1 Tax=Stackebrandtia albiflava TaxID=406432 RepID=A0A562UYN5_9ACTN|nr:DUF5667 domain-containing protein [Stackebrandtia albiflava]TWJ10713.1 hypothetical protein LX16_4134 [Stackebrandtia albiflava]